MSIADDESIDRGKGQHRPRDLRDELDQLRHDLGDGASLRIIVDGLSSTIKDLHSRQDINIAWMNTMKGGLAAMGLLIGVVVYLYLDVREQLNEKASSVQVDRLEQRGETRDTQLDRHLEAIDDKIEKLRERLNGALK